MAAPIPAEQVEQWQADIRQKDGVAQPPANAEAATTFHDDGQLTYRGRTYRTRTASYREGLRLHALNFDLRQVLQQEPTEAVLRETLRVIDAMLGLMWSLVRWPWTLRHFGANPFLDAEVTEVQALADFFSPARMRSPVEGWVSVRAPAWLRSTIPTNTSPSLIGIRASWRRTVTRVAGGILRPA
jgi:hypothetical protein